MRNEAMFVKQSDLNEFTRKVKEICLKDGKCHVKLRDGSWRDVVYQPHDDEKDCEESFRTEEWGMVWNMDGSSITRDDFTMVEVQD